MATAIINGIRVTGTPEELARLMQLAKSADGAQPARRMPRWVDKTGDAPQPRPMRVIAGDDAEEATR